MWLNAEFSSALCPETWKVANGVVEITGQSEAVKNAQALEMKREEEMTDAFGNTVKVWLLLSLSCGGGRVSAGLGDCTGVVGVHPQPLL